MQSTEMTALGHASPLGFGSAGPPLGNSSAGGAAVTATAVRVFRGMPKEARAVRRWVRALTGTACASALDDAEIAADELFANAVTHTRSGALGGKITVVVVPDEDGVAVHIHDQGANDSQMPGMLPFSVGEYSLLDSGRGLQLVDSISAGWGTGPAIYCAQAVEDDPAVSANGRCTWFRLLGGAKCHPTQKETGSPSAVMACEVAG